MSQPVRFVSYVRVSTQQQGRSGLGLEAQRAAVAAYVCTRGNLLREFVEIETAKGADALERRPQLREALALCRREDAILVIAKLDRLARNVHFVSGLLESRVEFVAADMPEANKTMIQIHAVMSEWERDQISARTRAALAAAKARGVTLGACGPSNLRKMNERKTAQAQAVAERLRSVVLALRESGISQRGIAAELNALGIAAPRGGAWSLVQVQRLLARLDAAPATV